MKFTLPPPKYGYVKLLSNLSKITGELYFRCEDGKLMVYGLDPSRICAVILEFSDFDISCEEENECYILDEIAFNTLEKIKTNNPIRFEFKDGSLTVIYGDKRRELYAGTDCSSSIIELIKNIGKGFSKYSLCFDFPYKYITDVLRALKNMGWHIGIKQEDYRVVFYDEDGRSFELPVYSFSLMKPQGVNRDYFMSILRAFYQLAKHRQRDISVYAMPDRDLTPLVFRFEDIGEGVKAKVFLATSSPPEKPEVEKQVVGSFSGNKFLEGVLNNLYNILLFQYGDYLLVYQEGVGIVIDTSSEKGSFKDVVGSGTIRVDRLKLRNKDFHDYGFVKKEGRTYFFIDDEEYVFDAMPDKDSVMLEILKRINEYDMHLPPSFTVPVSLLADVYDDVSAIPDVRTIIFEYEDNVFRIIAENETVYEFKYETTYYYESFRVDIPITYFENLKLFKFLRRIKEDVYVWKDKYFINMFLNDKPNITMLMIFMAEERKAKVEEKHEEKKELTPVKIEEKPKVIDLCNSVRKDLGQVNDLEIRYREEFEKYDNRFHELENLLDVKAIKEFLKSLEDYYYRLDSYRMNLEDLKKSLEVYKPENVSKCIDEYNLLKNTIDAVLSNISKYKERVNYFRDVLSENLKEIEDAEDLVESLGVVIANPFIARISSIEWNKLLDRVKNLPPVYRERLKGMFLKYPENIYKLYKEIPEILQVLNYLGISDILSQYKEKEEKPISFEESQRWLEEQLNTSRRPCDIAQEYVERFKPSIDFLNAFKDLCTNTVDLNIIRKYREKLSFFRVTPVERRLLELMIDIAEIRRLKELERIKQAKRREVRREEKPTPPEGRYMGLAYGLPKPMITMRHFVVRRKSGNIEYIDEYDIDDRTASSLAYYLGEPYKTMVLYPPRYRHRIWIPLDRMLRHDIESKIVNPQLVTWLEDIIKVIEEGRKNGLLRPENGW